MNYYFSFLLLQKRTKKGAPQSITSRLWDCSLIKLLYYSGFGIGNSTLGCSQLNLIKAVYNLMDTHTGFLMI